MNKFTYYSNQFPDKSNDFKSVLSYLNNLSLLDSYTSVLFCYL